MNNPFTNYVVGILMFTFCIMGGMYILAGFQQTDSTFIDSGELTRFNNSVNVYADITSSVDTLKSSVEGTNSTNYNPLGVVGTLFSQMFNTMKLLLTSFSFFTDAITAAGEILLIPSWVITIVIAIITIILVFSIIYFIMGRTQ